MGLTIPELHNAVKEHLPEKSELYKTLIGLTPSTDGRSFILPTAMVGIRSKVHIAMHNEIDEEEREKIQKLLHFILKK